MKKKRQTQRPPTGTMRKFAHRDRNALLRLRADREHLHKQISNLHRQLNDQFGFVIGLEMLARPNGETLTGEVPIRDALFKALGVHATSLRNCKDSVGRLLEELGG